MGCMWLQRKIFQLKHTKFEDEHIYEDIDESTLETLDSFRGYKTSTRLPSTDTYGKHIFTKDVKTKVRLAANPFRHGGSEENLYIPMGGTKYKPFCRGVERLLSRTDEIMCKDLPPTSTRGIHTQTVNPFAEFDALQNNDPSVPERIVVEHCIGFYIDSLFVNADRCPSDDACHSSSDTFGDDLGRQCHSLETNRKNYISRSAKDANRINRCCPQTQLISCACTFCICTKVDKTRHADVDSLRAWPLFPLTDTQTQPSLVQLEKSNANPCNMLGCYCCPRSTLKYCNEFPPQDIKNCIYKCEDGVSYVNTMDTKSTANVVSQTKKTVAGINKPGKQLMISEVIREQDSKANKRVSTKYVNTSNNRYTYERDGDQRKAKNRVLLDLILYNNNQRL